jgi:hypothetical protein
MNANTRFSSSRPQVIMGLLLLSACGAWAQTPAASTDPHTASGLRGPSGKEYIQVRGHLPLEGMRVNQMFIQQRGEKTYLFLHRPDAHAYALVDVTKPDAPKLVSRDDIKGGQVEGPATGSVLAINVVPESGSTQSSATSLPTETIHFLDLSDPKNPKSVKSFQGVTAVYPDDSRKLVYLVNSDGLWIVSHRMTHPLPLCNSESALTPEPDCQ